MPPWDEQMLKMGGIFDLQECHKEQRKLPSMCLHQSKHKACVQFGCSPLLCCCWALWWYPAWIHGISAVRFMNPDIHTSLVPWYAAMLNPGESGGSRHTGGRIWLSGSHFAPVCLYTHTHLSASGGAAGGTMKWLVLHACACDAESRGMNREDKHFESSRCVKTGGEMRWLTHFVFTIWPSHINRRQRGPLTSSWVTHTRSYFLETTLGCCRNQADCLQLLRGSSWCGQSERHTFVKGDTLMSISGWLKEGDA